VREILALRQEEARLLGYNNFGEVSVVPKMADSPEESSLSCATWPPRPSPMPNKDLADMRAFAAKELGLADPQAWDWPYVGEKAQGSALRLQRTGSQAVLHRTQGAGRACSRLSKPCLRSASAATARRCGTLL
jgi:Zn-dependent oligopeptidase